LSGGPALFHNTMPDRLAEELRLAASLGVNRVKVGELGFDRAIEAGTVKWAITVEGELWLMPKWGDGVELAHTVLTRGAPVLAAGEADIAGSSGEYFLLWMDNRSGHYRPDQASLDLAGHIFAANGIRRPIWRTGSNP
jgi:hypothetical protein